MHRRQAPAERAALFVLRVARRGVLLPALPTLLALAIYLCFASTPAP